MNRILQPIGQTRSSHKRMHQYKSRHKHAQRNSKQRRVRSDPKQNAKPEHQKPRSENSNQSKPTSEKSIPKSTQDQTEQNRESPRSKQEGWKSRAKFTGLLTDLGEKWEKGLNEKLTRIEESRFERSAPNRMIDLSCAKREAVLHNQMRIRELWGLYFYKAEIKF